ncbi:Hypothetical protein PHPALM_4412 [Phytophthora palmivora]|uniref:Uncharacterized protein n=1 Tax=Phytophthora palmivora TaxID=4796 RepID=A0A2P4YJZ1_9STRA|nr:Hypothetical protein PHPALM_4412 [Phytophthora palmivora]
MGVENRDTPEDHHRSTAALRRRVLHLSNELRQAIRRADEATDLDREHICSLESLEMMCANQGREIGYYRTEVSRLREERDNLQASLESDRVVSMEPSSTAPEISALEAQIADLNHSLDRRIDQIRHLEAHIDDLARDRGNLESTIHHLASEMAQAGGEILDLQQANRDLDREREDAESTLSEPEESLRRTRSELDRVEAELLLSRSDRTDRGSSGLDPQSRPADLPPTGPTQADLDQIVRERDSLQDQIRARDVEILSAQRTLGLLQSDLAAHRARSASDTTRLQTLEGDLTRARHDVEVAQKAYADRERTITENQAQIRTLSQDLGKVVRERDALRHEYTAAFQRLTSISATIGAPPPQTQLRLDPGSDTDQPAGGIPRSPSAETSGSENQYVDTSKSKRSRSRSNSPSPSRPQKKRSVPLEADDGSMNEEDESEFDLGGGIRWRKIVIEVGSASDEEEEEEEENAEVADDLYEAQTLMTISQSRSEARRRDHASPQRRSAGGSGGSPDGSNGSDSDTGSGGQGNGAGPTGVAGPASPPSGRQPRRITFVPQVPFPEDRCIPGRRIARAMAAADIDPWIESRLANQTLITMTVNFLFPILPFRPEWIFPHRPTIYTSPTTPAFCGHLITEANVKALQAAEPWRVIRKTLPPISFEADVGGRLGIFIRQYRDFEASELIAYWESTHKFPITAAMITQSPWLGSFAKQRNNRSSHAGNRWKRMLLTLIQAMIEGWCDLDQLLDPFFPKRTDELAWYPGIEARRANLADPQLNRREPADLLEALVETDTADPWRNHYRDHTADHPARHLPHLDRKFFGLQVAQPPASS